MAKTPKTRFVCSECGYETARWMGKCPDCGSWNTLQEEAVPAAAPAAASAQVAPVPVLRREELAQTLDTVQEEPELRTPTGIQELDRVLGGGVVPGSLILLGGDPGIGKSTLLLQAADCLARRGSRVLYASGEESVRQIKMRASRLHVDGHNLHVISETNIHQVEAQRAALTPDFMVIDSIQTMFLPEKNAAPGSVSQVREVTAQLMRCAKQNGVSIFLVGHVTKDGSLAGPRVLEHMVDAVLSFEGDGRQDHRILRAIKNRFGSVNEIGVFRMLQNGMQQVPNPSEFLLAGRLPGATGAAVTASMEGTRPVLVDIQALVAPTSFVSPRRQALGFDYNRMALLLAVLEKRAGFPLYNQDAYVNVAGGLELDEPAADLCVAMALVSSIKNKPVPENWVLIGEIGLSGELRAVGQIERRLSECRRMGFENALIPSGNLHGLNPVEGLSIYGASTVQQALTMLF